MRVIILEGIATSGKTIVKNKLAEMCMQEGLRFVVVEEDETLMPLLHNTEKQVSLEFLNRILDAVLKKELDVVIFDRLYFTHIFRTGSSLGDFRVIEDMLLKQALLVLLTIGEANISERIENARKHRDIHWNAYVNKKGTPEEIAKYYIEQQRTLAGLFGETALEHMMYDTTDMHFDVVAMDIFSRVFIR